MDLRRLPKPAERETTSPTRRLLPLVARLPLEAGC
jgi:hypothetical protein